MDGLLNLFGGKNTLSSGFTFSKETYEAAKPFFIQAARSLGQAARDIKEMVRAIIRAFKARGATADQVKQMTPYLDQFRKDVVAGTLDPFAEPKAPKRENTEAATEFQVAYEPRSQARFAVGTLVPRAMQDAMNRALDKIEAKNGNIDAYVAKELGYTLDHVVGSDTKEGYFSAEQIDALAMAIHNVSQNKGFIIGDQTGVGKGRFVAAMLRYGALQGRIPVFVTQKPGLYADMIRDLRDIGMADAQARIIATNANLQPVPITGDDDLFSGAKKKELDALYAALREGKMPDGKTFLFTTYDQITTTAGRWPERALALRQAAPNVMLVLDESHTAGGTAQGDRAPVRIPGTMPDNRADFFRDMVGMAAGTVFSSATYAKNPTVMSLYSSTDLALSVDDIKKLGPAIESGGVPLQQVAATQLTESGQYVRRERSFAGVDFAPSEMVTKREHAVRVSALISGLADFDRQHMEGIRNTVSQNFQAGGFIGVKDTSVGTAGATSAGFGSTVHNLVNQFLLAAKLDASADAAIAAWKAGEKPVLTLMNVNTSIVDEYLAGLKIEKGKPVSVPFTAIMDRYLERLRYITVETVEGDKIKYRIPDEDIGDDVLAIMEDLKEQIRTAPLEGLTGSPVDAILDKLRAAGMKVDEITGRQRVIDNGTVGSRVNNSAENKRRMNDFNSGKLDALILSASGSTGFSLHATGKKGNDGKKRHMIVLQAHADINVFMQTLGRVHRTGQIITPRYTLAFSDLSIEKRAAAVLMKKMASLNANTTAGKSSSTTLTDVTDFINEVGDKVVADYLREDPMLALRLGFMVGTETPPDIARKATGRFIYLPPDEVDAHYDAIEFAYRQRLEQLESEGTSPLEAKTLDLQARTLSSAVLRPGTGGDSPFGAPLVAERVSAKKAGVPYKASKVREKVAETLANNGGGTGPWHDAKKAVIDDLVPGYSQAGRDRLAERTAGLDAADEALASARKKWSDARTLLNGAEQNRDQTPEKLAILRRETEAARRFYEKASRDRVEADGLVEAAKARIENEAERVRAIKQELVRYAPGNTFSITRGEDEFFAVVLDVDVSKMAGNPTAAGRIRVRFAVADAAREVVFTLNQLMDQAGVSASPVRQELAFAAFDAGQSNRREERTIMTGNLIGGVDQFRGGGGRVVYYTTEDGEIKAGVLMPGRFDLRAALSDQDVAFDTAEQAARFITENAGMLKADDRLASIQQNGRNQFMIVVPKKGRAYFQLRAVQPLIETFREVGRNYTGTIRAPNLVPVIRAYTDNLGTKWVTESHKDEARAITGVVLPDLPTQESRVPPTGWSEVEPEAPITPADIRKMTAAINAEMARSGLAGKVPARVVREVTTKTLFGIERRPKAQGNFSRLGIQVRAGAAAGEVGVLRHEIIHALRNAQLWGKPYGLFTQAEWQALVKAARADKALMARIEELYPDLTPDKQIEEAVAELYRMWAEGGEGVGLIQKAFERVQAFFRALANALRGEGFADAARTMDMIATGRIGGRMDQARYAFDAEPETQDMRFGFPDLRSSATALTGKRRWRHAEGAYWSDLLTNAMSGWSDGKVSALALVPGRALFSELGKNLFAAKAYLRAKEEMDALRNGWHARADKVAQAWRSLGSKDRAKNQDMMNLMHEATMDQVDPSMPDTWTHPFELPARRAVSEMGDDAPLWAQDVMGQIARHKATYRSLRAKFDALTPELQAMFRKVRDEHSALADDTEKALIENVGKAAKVAVKRAERAYRKEMNRIRDEGLEGEEREIAEQVAKEKRDAVVKAGGWASKVRMAQLRQSFEKNRLKGPYFPLTRFGDLFLTVRDETGAVVAFNRFEDAGKQREAVEEAKEELLADMEGATQAEKDAAVKARIQFGALSDDGTNMRDMVDPRFVSEVMGILQDSGTERATLDAVWQHWLETLPDRSMRKNRIHRKNRKGFETDAFRAFGKAMFHGAHQLAKLKYGLEMEEHLNDAVEEATRQDDPVRAQLVVNEMRKRHEFTMNPKASAFVQAASQISFIWYLGLSPAAAIANLSQTTVVGVPIMTAHFGMKKAKGVVTELAKASADFARGRGAVVKRIGGVPVWTEAWSAQNASTLTADEKAAIEEAYRRGTLDKTQSHDLAGVQETGIEYNARRERVMRTIGFLFHHTERFNREVTFLASYRLARRSGQTHEEAIQTGADLTWKTHMDYQNTSKARIMQGDDAKNIIFIFRNFTVNMLWRLFRDTHQMLMGATPEVRQEARTQLIGISLSMFAHAGIRGVWGYGLLMMLLGMFGGGGDEAEEWLQDALLMEGDALGVAAWNWIMGAALNGIPGHVTGTDLTDRIGMPNLWFRGQDRDLEMQDSLSAYVEELLGPALGVAVGGVRGLDLALDGELWRGIEAAVPKPVRDAMKAGRFMVEGATTLNDDPLVEQFSPLELIAQLNGFTPAELAERYRMNNRLKNAEKRIMDDRREIQHAIGDAVMDGQPIPADMIEKMRAFNREYPEYPITRDSLKQSITARRRASQNNESGIQLNPKLNARLRGDLAPAVYQ